MATTVYFATNRVVTNASDPDEGYTSIMVPPLKPEEITYGTAIVDGIDVATNAQGFVSEIKDTKQGGFSDQAIGYTVEPRLGFARIHPWLRQHLLRCPEPRGLQPRMACCVGSPWDEHDCGCIQLAVEWPGCRISGAGGSLSRRPEHGPKLGAGCDEFPGPARADHRGRACERLPGHPPRPQHG